MSPAVGMALSKDPEDIPELELVPVPGHLGGGDDLRCPVHQFYTVKTATKAPENECGGCAKVWEIATA